jgi:hypothetical protein
MHVPVYYDNDTPTYRDAHRYNRKQRSRFEVIVYCIGVVGIRLALLTPT